MYDLVVRNARIHTMADGLAASSHSAFAVRGGRVVAFDPPFETAARATLDARGALVLTGFVDCHTHALYAGDRMAAHGERLGRRDLRRDHREHVRRAADKYQLAEELLHAVMAVESGFRPGAISQKGAMGLMQLMPDTARMMYVRYVWSPEENIDGGARYLRVLANQYGGDLIKTRAAYNAGPEAVKRAGGVPSYPETQEYVRMVLGIYEQLKSRNARGDG